MGRKTETEERATKVISNMKQIEYKVGDDILSIIEECIYEVTGGKITDVAGGDKVTIHTGIGGLGLIHKSLKSKVENSPVEIETESFILTPLEKTETSCIYFVPALKNIVFKLDIESDKVEVDPISNPMIVGYRKTSLCYNIEWKGDITAQISCIGKLES